MWIDNKCGTLKMSSKQTTEIKVKPARMEGIKVTHFEDEKATLSEKDLIKILEKTLRIQLRPAYQTQYSD